MSIVPPSPRALGAVRRKAMNVSEQQLVTERLLSPDHALPLVIEPAVSGVDLIAWATRERASLEKKLLEYGALLFRGFNVASVEQFDQVIAALSPALWNTCSAPRPGHGSAATSTPRPTTRPTR